MLARPEDVRDDPKALPRDITRFKSLYPNGEAEIRDDATGHLAFVTSFELIAEAERANL